MLDPKYLENVTKELEEQFAKLEIEILEDIARRIRMNEYAMTSTAQYQINQLKALGATNEEISKMISEKLNVARKQVDKIISDSTFDSLKNDNDVFKQAFEEGVIPSFNYKESAFKELILKGVEETNGEIRNICKSTAKSAQKEFTKATDYVYLSVKSGAFDFDTAVTNAIKNLSKQGLSYIDYESGVRRRLDSAIRNAVRTGINQTALKCQDKNLEEMGGNLVVTSSHAGARFEHAMWQGQVFWKKSKVKGYKNFEEATGYGTGAGLGGWNCRHSYYPYFEGVSTNPFDKIDEEENAKEYELTQEQRYNERMIREWDRRRKVCEAAGIDSSKENAKYREWRARQKELLDSNPQLKRNFARENVVLTSKNGKIDISDIHITGALDPYSNKANKHAEQYYESVRKMKTDYKKIAVNTGYSEHEIKSIKNYLFIDKHELSTATKRFDANYMIGESWRRLIDGKNIQNHDLTLIKHEIYEKKLMKDGLSQNESHIKATSKFNYQKESEEYYAKINKYKKSE